MNTGYLICIKAVVLLTVCLLSDFQHATAQLNPMGAMYFQNHYIVNPAFAGSGGGLNLNLGYRKQFNNIPGGPEIQTLTVDYALNNKVGFGLNIYYDKAGLFKRNRTVASYAYHLPLNGEDKKLSFGLSIGFMNEWINNEDINGDPGDVNLTNYNDRDTYIDGDFGLSYESNEFNIQAGLPNMKNYLKKDLIINSLDRSTFFSAVSYTFKFSEGAEAFGMEPKICYRGLQGLDNVLDVGANLSYGGSRLNLFGMYHSSENATFGFGLNYQALGFTGMYTTETSALRGYSSSNFELNLKVNLFK